MTCNLEHRIQSNILGKFLYDRFRERIREDAGSAYKLSSNGLCHHNGGLDVTILDIYIPMDPEFCSQALAIINEEIDNACHSIDEQALAGIKRSMLLQYEQQLKKDTYWQERIQEYVMYNIDEYSKYHEVVKAQTSDSIAAFARELMSTGNRVEIVITPKKY